jgi:hypothetical protein
MNKLIVFIAFLNLPFILAGQPVSKDLLQALPNSLSAHTFKTDTISQFNPEDYLILEKEKTSRVYLAQIESAYCLIKPFRNAWLRTTLFDTTHTIINKYRLNFDNTGSKELVIEFLKKSEEANYFITQKTTLLLNMDQATCMAYIPVLNEKTDKKTDQIVLRRKNQIEIKQNHISLTLMSDIDVQKNNYEALIKPLKVRYSKKGDDIELKTPGYKKLNKTISAQQVHTLKNGALLVRLKTNEKRIEALRKANKKEEAEHLHSTTQSANREIIASFKKNFNFCAVYFFMSYDSENVTNKNWEAVSFVDENLSPLANQPQLPPVFFIAEFGTTDTESGTGMTGLIVKTPDFKQLNKPFPYFSTTTDPLQKRINTTPSVRKLNARLSKYHGKVLKNRKL